MRVSDQVARRIAAAYAAWHTEFRGMTRRARGRFARREWLGGQEDAAARLGSYGSWVDRLVSELGVLPPNPRAHWARVRDAFAREVAGTPDADLAATFFNSVTRRLLGTIGSDPNAEFGAPLDAVAPETPAFVTLPVAALDAALLAQLMDRMPVGAPFEDLERDLALAAAALERERATIAADVGPPTCVDLLPGVFYRNKGAYVVARLRGSRGVGPLVLALVHDARGVALDAVLTSADEVSAVFGFTRSYFHADLVHPAPVIEFLGSIMPVKREDELWTALGYHRHAKRVFYRTLVRHLEEPGARFEPSEGDRGMVMSVFTLPSLNVVFKLIKDRFDPPKSTTREQVLSRYELVFRHDRVGRLADAQEFDHLRLRRDSFSPALLEELRAVAGRTVLLDGDSVVVRHAYVERRVTPLNLYLRDAAPDAALAVTLDYGQAVRDLAAANIFPGDMLLKNFGVTRHGRVIFYDYDELCLLTDCRIRRLPEARAWEDEMASEPWFAVREGDVFPEEFRAFVMLPGELGRAFEAQHGALFDPAFWEAMQQRQRAGEVVDFFPYPRARRLRPREGEAGPR
ncbi:MAG TPA: bifunctional isocitrate dehydrogenase kinase/phosphatase [Gemmatimonadales bacterium]|nr:bifunctional isocitrate dehydrogenase kinase/phosphatase [Gemmatimonadales bacterium]